MRDYIISCCSTADLTEEHFKARDISYICFHFELNGKEYADDLGKSIPFDQFYAAMAAGADTKTSQVNAEEFEEYFEPFLKAGKDILVMETVTYEGMPEEIANDIQQMQATFKVQ